jgi:hypothetical protein
MSESRSTPEVYPSPPKERRWLRPASISAFVGIAGLLWYCVASLAAGYVYEPLGVQPREVGLSSSTLVAQATIGLLATFLLLAIGVVVAMFILLARDVGAFRHAQTEAEGWGQLIVLSVAGVFATAAGVLVSIVIALALLVFIASSERESLREGHSPGFIFGLSPPWTGEVATLRWTGPAHLVVGLPSCALYLGQADGTAVFFDAIRRRTLRVTTSTVLIETQPHRRSC